MGEPIRANVSINLGFVSTTNVTAHTDGGKWVTVNPDTLEKVLGPNYDPNNPVMVIGNNPQPQPSGGTGGEEPGGSSGGGGGGGGTPKVEVVPVNPPSPPVRENEAIAFGSEPDFYHGGIREDKVEEIIGAPYAEIATIEIIGTLENYPVF